MFDRVQLRRDTRLVIRAVILAALAALILASPASAAKTHNYAYDVLDAGLTETMTFQSDAPTCQRAGVCGYSGTVTYSFAHITDGFGILSTRRRHVSGAAFFDIGGLTTATVQGPGGGPPCTDKVISRFDAFRLLGTTAHPQIVFHNALTGPQYLNTYCAGPKDADIARLIPPLPLPRGAIGRRSLFAQASTTAPFHAGPFVGTLSFSAAVRLRKSNLSDLFSVIVA